MTANFLWGATGTVQHLLTTELNSLANGTLTSLGPEIDNTTGAFQMGQLYVHMASAAFVEPSYINIYLIPSVGTAGTTYPAPASSSAELANYLVATIYINGTTAAHDVDYPYITIPPGKFKAAAATGGSCPTLAASGNTVDLYPTPTQY